MYLIKFETSDLPFLSYRAKYVKNVLKGSLRWVGVKGPHTQVKCPLEALIFGTCKKNIIMYSQMRFQLYQSHSLTVTGLKIGKKSKYWVFMGAF